MAASAIEYDRESAVCQFISLALVQRNLLEQAAWRDAEALRILTVRGLPEAMIRVERRYWAGQAGHALRRIWTHRDQRRLAWMRGLSDGWCPPCRLARLLSRFCPRSGHGLIVEQFRRALDETRRDGSASVVGPLLTAAKSAHERLFDAAREIAQSDRVPVCASLGVAQSELSQAIANLMEVAPLPKPTSTCSPARTKVAPIGSELREQWPTVETLSDIGSQTRRLAEFIRDSMPTTERKRPFGANAMPAVLTELDRVTYLFYGRTLADFETDREQVARLGWWISLAGWIVATPGSHEFPGLHDDLAKNPLRFLHANYQGWDNPVPTHVDALFWGLATLRVYFGQIVFSRDSWIHAGAWLRQEINDRAVGLACRPGAVLGPWFEGEMCREPLFLLRKPGGYCSPNELRNGAPMPPQIRESGTYHDPKTNGIPADWLDALDHYATKLLKAIGESAAESMPSQSVIPVPESAALQCPS